MLPAPRFAPHALLISVLALNLTACANTLARLGEMGTQPAMSKVTDPTKEPGYTPVTTPVPTAVPAEAKQLGSIWQQGARAFFKDQRASRVGDVVTVNIVIDDSAKLANETQGNRNDTETVGMPNLLGFETQLGGILPHAFNPSTAISTSGVAATDGKGQINRSEQINLKVAALVTQVLPNGNMVVVGKQEVRVNYDVRDLAFTGIIRPVDIDSLNTITWEKIAEARISYAGHGQSEDLQQPRVGTQLIDILSPF